MSSEDEEVEKEKIDIGDKEENVYSDSARKELVDSGGISAREEGFMEGYNEEKAEEECDTCENIITEKKIVKEIDGERHTFCSQKCADEYKGD